MWDISEPAAPAALDPLAQLDCLVSAAARTLYSVQHARWCAPWRCRMRPHAAPTLAARAASSCGTSVSPPHPPRSTRSHSSTAWSVQQHAHYIVYNTRGGVRRGAVARARAPRLHWRQGLRQVVGHQ
ncbi:unnamed protein product [Parnassius apollo]|uniref:(apollo) hypothetical protein n=1 Tax=Parnassius apollo TaxID=110799 RepID=A0A8S3W4R1_PARAO|nr:unnamed protein product [Parnassius apollo]